MMNVEELKEAFTPAWRLANRKDEETGQLLRPDYRRALVDVWEDLMVAYYSSQQRDKAADMRIYAAIDLDA